MKRITLLTAGLADSFVYSEMLPATTGNIADCLCLRRVLHFIAVCAPDDGIK